MQGFTSILKAAIISSFVSTSFAGSPAVDERSEIAGQPQASTDMVAVVVDKAWDFAPWVYSRFAQAPRTSKIDRAVFGKTFCDAMDQNLATVHGILFPVVDKGVVPAIQYAAENPKIVGGAFIAVGTFFEQPQLVLLGTGISALSSQKNPKETLKGLIRNFLGSNSDKK